MNARAFFWFLFGLTIAIFAASASAGWSYGSDCYPDRARAMRAASQAMPRLQEPAVYPTTADPCQEAIGGYVCTFYDASGYFAGSYRLTPCFENKPTASSQERRPEGSRESGPRSPQGLAVSGAPCCPNVAIAELPAGLAGRPGQGYGESTTPETASDGKRSGNSDRLRAQTLDQISIPLSTFPEPLQIAFWAVTGNTAQKGQK